MLSNQELYRQLYRIRRFEETVLDNFPRGVFAGTTHTCLGQEANAVGVIACLREDDILFSNHRGHGHFLAYGGDPRALFAELMGKATGVCGGRGGSQHLHWRNFYSNGVQGGFSPVAAGIAFAEKRKGTKVVTLAFLGDGTFGEGVLYEALNLASLWSLPVLFVVEHNDIAQTTPTHLALAGEIAARFAAFGISTTELDTADVLEILPVANQQMEEIRRDCQPRALVLKTCRFGPHSKGDDPRPEAELKRMRQARDPVQIQARRLEPDELQAIETSVEAEIQAAYSQALEDPLPIP